MRHIFHYSFISLFALLLMACSGGNELSDSGTTPGTGGATPPSTVITLTLVDQNNETTNQISTSMPGKLRALVTVDNVPQVGVKVDFSLPDDIGVLTTTSALTKDDGVAEVELTAGTVTNAGTAEATYDGVTAELVFNVTVSVIDENVEIAMSPITTTPNSIGANGTASLSVTMTETSNGTTTNLSQSVGVEFTSDCSLIDLATIDTDVTTSNGVATATYQDKGCGRVDTIRARATVGQEQFSQEATLNVESAELGSIEFVSATPSVIALKGTGGVERSETSSLVFVVKDVIGNTVTDAEVNFSLSTDVGGITISPEQSAKTNSNGQVTVIVAAGNVPTSVIVTATLADEPTIATISSSLSISTGVADANSFSLSATELVPEALNIDGTEVTITARLADHFNNPVPNGTVVNFSAEFGRVEAECLTTDGSCSVVWNSQAPKSPDPAFRDANAITRRVGVHDCLDNTGAVTNLSEAGLPCPGTLGPVFGNRVSIFAYTQGEESFVDANSNGRYDAGEAYTDLSEAFRDDNSDGYFSGRLLDGSIAARENPLPTNGSVQPGGDNEEYIDFNGNKQFDGRDGKYNGTLCNDEEDGCSSELITIGKNIIILQAGSHPSIGMIEHSSDISIWDKDNYFKPVRLYEITTEDDPNTPANEEVRVQTSREVRVFFADIHNGSMPNGTTVEFETSNGQIVGRSSFPLTANNAHGINEATVNLKADDDSDSGSLTVIITTPGGTRTSTSIPIID